MKGVGFVPLGFERRETGYELNNQVLPSSQLGATGPLSKAELRSACRTLLSTTTITYKSLFHRCYIDNGVWRLVFGSICYWAGYFGPLIAGRRILGATFR